MQPELRLIRYFVAVAEEGNFTRAAERLQWLSRRSAQRFANSSSNSG